MVSNFITSPRVQTQVPDATPAGFTQPSATPPEHFRCSDVHGPVHESVHESAQRLILRWFNVLSLNGMNGTDGDGGVSLLIPPVLLVLLC